MKVWCFVFPISHGPAAKKNFPWGSCCISPINDSLWSESSASGVFFFQSYRGNDSISQHWNSWQLSGGEKKKQDYLKKREKRGSNSKSGQRWQENQDSSCTKSYLISARDVVCRGEWQLLIKIVTDYHVRNDKICWRPGVEDESLLFVENANLKLCIFRGTSVAYFL